MRSCPRGQTSILERQQPIYVSDGGKEPSARLAKFGDAWLANSLPPAGSEPLITEMQSLGVKRVLLNLPTLPEAKTLRKLTGPLGWPGRSRTADTPG